LPTGALERSGPLEFPEPGPCWPTRPESAALHQGQMLSTPTSMSGSCIRGAHAASGECPGSEEWSFTGGSGGA
jgi:hypothetical protein